MKIVPIQTPELNRGRMIKNSALDPALELFRSNETGFGQIMIDELDAERGHHMFGWPLHRLHPDLEILRKLARLTAYDVYTLRIQFRDLGIEPSYVDYLRLSPEKKKSLHMYMRVFTLPLIDLVYGEGDTQAQKTDNVIDLFRHPDTRVARENLFKLARGLGVDIGEIPRFLEDFSDIYLSLSYYQEYLDDLTPKVIDMVGELGDMSQNWQLRQDPYTIETITRVQSEINDLLTSVTSRFEAFRQHSDDIWNDIDANKFKSTKRMVITAQETVGGVLCGLGIKLNAWKERFPTSDAGGPVARSEMMFSEIVPGLDKLVALERSGREAAGQAVKRAEESFLSKARSAQASRRAR